MGHALIRRGLGLLFCLGAVVAAGPAHGQPKTSDSLRKQVLAWLDRHYTDTDGETQAKVRQLVQNNLDQGHDWVLTFGPAVMRSGRAYQVHVFAGRFYTFALSEAQARKRLSGPAGITLSEGERCYQVQTPQIILKSVRIDGSCQLDPHKKITGTVSYKLKGDLPAGVSLRLSYRVGNSFTQTFCRLSETLDRQEGTCRFSFSPLHGDDDSEAKLKTGPLVVFVDVCTVTQLQEDPYIEVKVLSNSAGVLLDVAEAGPSVASPSLVGTKWRFPGTQTTIEFLEDGRFLWNGKPANGFWKQDGTAITINVNDYTLFELTMDGDSMTGTWKRLQGDEAGQKNPSGLKRIRD
jgi:hypothetical protein